MKHSSISRINFKWCSPCNGNVTINQLINTNYHTGCVINSFNFTITCYEKGVQLLSSFHLIIEKGIFQMHFCQNHSMVKESKVCEMLGLLSAHACCMESVKLSQQLISAWRLGVLLIFAYFVKIVHAFYLFKMPSPNLILLWFWLQVDVQFWTSRWHLPTQMWNVQTIHRLLWTTAIFPS